MKFNIKWALAVIVVVLVGLAAEPWTVSQNAKIAAIETQIKAGSGLRLVSHGRSVFAVLPRPHIRIYDARLERSGGALTLSTSSLRVDLALSGLATGQFSLARAILADAVFTLDTTRAPTLSAAANAAANAAKSAATSVKPQPGKDLVQDLSQGLGEVEVTNGKLIFRRTGSDKSETVAEDIDARLEWSGAGAPLSLVGHCLLPTMGEESGPARFALWAAQPDKWTRGDASAITMHIDDGAYVLNLNGALALSPFPHFIGQIDGAAPSLRVAAQWLGLPLPLPGAYRDATLKGEASLDSDLLSFPTLSISVDGNALDGAASIRLDGQRPQIAATLAGASVNLAPMIEDWPALSAGGQWSHDSFPSSHLASADLDLRLSANHVRLGDFQAESAALSAILKNGRLDLSLAEASAYSGQVRARAVIAENASAGFDLRGSLSAEKIDVAALLWDGFKRQALTGVGRGSLTFETSGDSFYELASHLDGRGDLAIDDGEIFGLDVGLAFRRMERRPLTAGVELRSGRTAFTTLATKFSIVQGVVDIEEGVTRDERMTTYFSGRAQIADRTLDLHAAATRPSTSGDASPLQLGFSISGGWDDATVVPDALGLINRSDAAAPLLLKRASPQ